MKTNIAEAINVLGAFCGKRDVPFLTQEELHKKYGIKQADVMVLFGGSIMCGGDVLAQAMKEKVAKHYLIVGGEGHTTQSLRDRMHEAFPQIGTNGLPEAKVFDAYLKMRYGLSVDYLECNSTNCGNNITYLLDTLEEHQIEWSSIILTQDATMQHRMEAGLRKHLQEDGRPISTEPCKHLQETSKAQEYNQGKKAFVEQRKHTYTIINYASYQAVVVNSEDGLKYTQDIWGMWDMDHYITLLMGEIPRLSDDENGYGPSGKNFIAHVDIPQEVQEAFELLNKAYKGYVREANSAYASK